MARASRAPAWSEIHGVRLHQVGSSEASLVIQAGSQSFEIPSAAVTPHGDVLPRRILDEPGWRSLDRAAPALPAPPRHHRRADLAPLEMLVAPPAEPGHPDDTAEDDREAASVPHGL
jgi:hypothetical protein